MIGGTDIGANRVRMRSSTTCHVIWGKSFNLFKTLVSFENVDYVTNSRHHKVV